MALAPDGSPRGYWINSDMPAPAMTGIVRKVAADWHREVQAMQSRIHALEDTIAKERRAHREQLQMLRGSSDDAAKAAIAELEAWKANAVARYPDLAVDPVLHKARELLAVAMAPLGQAADVRDGMFDDTPAMTAIRAALRTSQGTECTNLRPAAALVMGQPPHADRRPCSHHGAATGKSQLG